MTTEKKLLELAKAEDIKMGKLLKIMETIADALDTISLAQSNPQEVEPPEYTGVEEYDHIKAIE